jgi:hypothetical protein
VSGPLIAEPRVSFRVEVSLDPNKVRDLDATIAQIMDRLGDAPKYLDGVDTIEVQSPFATRVGGDTQALEWLQTDAGSRWLREQVRRNVRGFADYLRDALK